MYQYIINTEVLLMTEFHMDSIGMFDDLTLLDLHFYIKRMEKNIEERNKRYSNTKALAT